MEGVLEVFRPVQVLARRYLLLFRPPGIHLRLFFIDSLYKSTLYKRSGRASDYSWGAVFYCARVKTLAKALLEKPLS